MNKLVQKKATRHALKVIDTENTVRNWTHLQAQRLLERAYLAGARMVDEWHRKQTRKPVAELPGCPECGAVGEVAGKGQYLCPGPRCNTYFFRATDTSISGVS